jgi:8-oxo-dGTP pyrophosphatase MutT (NUDIX family)
LNFESEHILISQGKWSGEIRWEFYASPDAPPENLTTAVCCVAIHDQKIILVKNNRGWELPGGKIMDNETSVQAVAREIMEETGYDIINPTVFGYKKIIAPAPVPNPEKPGTYYHFPYSYVIFFIARAIKNDNRKPCNEILEVKLIPIDDAIVVLEEGRQYPGILENIRQRSYTQFNL